MHELSIACGLVRAAVDEAARRGAARVVRIDAVIGALAGVDPDALAFCFPMTASGTPCAGAELRIEVELAQGRCTACGWTGGVGDPMSVCPRCAAWPLELEGGREMRLEALEVT